MMASRTPPTLPLAGDRTDPLEGTPYSATAAVGHGGMGEVFAAVHRALNRPVVVKLLHRQLADDPRFVDRLRVEALALAAVDSPHVVAVIDLGQTPAGRPYLVLERLVGHTLRKELERRGPLPAGEAIELIRQILEGLSAAHRRGIVHRDVKLENVFLCLDPSGRHAPIVKVLDFGIVKVLDADVTGAAPRYATEEGVLVGSPRTVAPEQIRFQAVDARTDVYAVGLLLYTLLVGRGPFNAAEDLLELLNAHLFNPPAPPSASAPQYVPPELDRAILKALAKRPEQRFQSAEQLSEELGRIGRALVDMTQPLRAPAIQDTDDAAVAQVTPLADEDTTTEVSAPPTAARGTLILAPSPRAPENPPAAAPSIDPDDDAWFQPVPDASPVVALPRNLTPPVRPRVDLGTFVVLTLASTVVFSVLAVLALRLMEAR